MHAAFLGHGRKTPMFSFDGKEFLARVVGCHDSDTVRVVYDTEQDGYKQLILRLQGIDAPEIRSSDPKEKKAAVAARDCLLSMMLQEPVAEGMTEKEVTALLDSHCVLVAVVCKTFDKYGRVLGELHNEGKTGGSFNQRLIDLGHAKPYFGKTKEAWEF